MKNGNPDIIDMQYVVFKFMFTLERFGVPKSEWMEKTYDGAIINNDSQRMYHYRLRRIYEKRNNVLR